ADLRQDGEGLASLQETERGRAQENPDQQFPEDGWVAYARDRPSGEPAGKKDQEEIDEAELHPLRELPDERVDVGPDGHAVEAPATTAGASRSAPPVLTQRGCDASRFIGRLGGSDGRPRPRRYGFPGRSA